MTAARAGSTGRVEIAIAVVEDAGKFLIHQRPAGAALAGLWEFPGGKVEPGESAAEAALRECREETGLAVRIAREYSEKLHDYDHASVRLHFFACTPLEPRAPLASGFQWVPRAQLRQYDFPAANAELIERLSGASESLDRAGREI